MSIDDPRDIAGLVLWYSAEAETGYADGDQMTAWTDLSGNGNHAIHTGTPWPLWRSTLGPGGGPAVAFTGGQFQLPAGVMTGKAAGEIAVTAWAPSSSNGWWIFGTAPDMAHFTYDGSVYDAFGSTTRKTVGPITTTTWHRYAVSSAAGAWNAWTDGAPRVVGAANVVAWPTTPLLGSSQTMQFAGRMAAVVLYDRTLTTSERADLDAWLAANPGGGFPAVAVAPPTDLTQTAATTTSVDVAWLAPVGGGVDGYRVRVDAGTATDVGPALAHTLPGLAADTAYLVEVQSYVSGGESGWVSVVATTAAVPPLPPGGYGTHLRVGAHAWDVVSTDAPTYGPLAGLRFTWDARQDDGWPTQHNPTVLVVGVIVEAGTDFDDVDQGTPVHFTFTPEGLTTPLVTFGGTVRDLVGRPHPLGMVYEITAVDYLQRLQEDTTVAVSIAANGAMSGTDGLWARATSDTDGYGPRPWFPDPFAGDVKPFDFPGATNGITPLVMQGTAWDVWTGLLGTSPRKPGGPAQGAHRGVLSYQLDAAGDLDAAHPFEGTWVPRPTAADPVTVDGGLLVTAGTTWSRPRIEPNVVIVTDSSLGELAPVERPHTGVDVVRRLAFTQGSYIGFTDPQWIIAGVEAADQWSTSLTLLAVREPELVAGWFTLPTAMTTYVVCENIDPRHTPTGSGELVGMLGGASLVIPPGGDWFVSFTLRKTLPSP